MLLVINKIPLFEEVKSFLICRIFQVFLYIKNYLRYKKTFYIKILQKIIVIYSIVFEKLFKEFF